MNLILNKPTLLAGGAWRLGGTKAVLRVSCATVRVSRRVIFYFEQYPYYLAVTSSTTGMGTSRALGAPRSHATPER